MVISSGYVFAGADFTGVWKRSLTDLMGFNKTSSQVPERFSLYQNYPNPFNPTTKIKFEIPNVNPPFTKGGQGGFSSLKIFDLLGREVTTLVNEKLSPGSYEVEWNADGFASGIYFYQLKTQSYTETKKMLLIK